MKQITSSENSLFRELRMALEPKGIKKYGRFLLSGQKVVTETLSQKKLTPAFLIVTDDMTVPEVDCHTLMLSKALFKELDTFGTHSPLLALETPKLPLWKQDEEFRGLEILCALSEPSNLGALLRSAAAFGATKLVLLKECATPFHPKAVRAASGQLMKVPLAVGPSIKELTGNQLFALDMDGENIAKFRWPRNVRLVLGQEGPGLPDLPGLTKLKIPMANQVESLNATVAASVALFSYRASISE